ncbi:MAG TPA: hypothetical protein VN937_09400, partial [Blastocatellia bacterium]|nr:hypothetical protein [Blastocatellia bacterium]
VSYTNQVVINSTTFSAGGDSGSLILSNDNPSCRHPVALLFAGSSSSTIANPIAEVLLKLTTALGSVVSFVGTTCATAPEIASGTQASAPSSASIDRATLAMRARENDLMSRPGIIGVGVGASDNDPNSASIVVYVDSNAASFPSVPRRINGVRVRVVYTEPFVAY